MTGTGTRPWSGRWVADALDVSFDDESGVSPLRMQELAGMALRHNPRRAHLLVSVVLGKHVPADPRLVYGAGRLLGALAADCIRGLDSGIAAAGGALLHEALAGTALASTAQAESAAAARALLAACEEHADRACVPSGTVVLGYAETATGLGHAVADATRADYLHSTRRAVAGVRPVAGFEEEHSHATSHLLLPGDSGMLSRAAPLVLVDDELSTGQTVGNTITALHELRPRDRYVVAALVDLRSPADRVRLAATAAALGVRIDVVALVAGHLTVPAGVLDRGRALVDAHRADPDPRVEPAGPARDAPGIRRAAIRRHEAPWPSGLPEGGRHGFPAARRRELEDAASGLAALLARRLHEQRPAGDRAGGRPMRVLVLGCEELMHAPARIAGHLADELARVDGSASVRFSSTTRSPVLAIDEPDYAIRTALTFPSHDDPADGPGPRYAYNVRRSDPADRFTDIVVVLDNVADTAGLEADSGFVGQLAGVADRVHVLTLPSYRPGAATVSAPSRPGPT